MPILPILPISPNRLPGISLALLKATALEAAILAGHVLLYPVGIAQERLTAAPAHDPAKPLTPTHPASASVPNPAGPAAADATATAEATATPRLPTPPGLPHPPVVLLHGFIDNRSVFVLLRRNLTQHGREHVISLNYSPLTCDIRTAAELLGRHLTEICDRTNSEHVDIVGHSLGGLIARYYAQRLGGDHRIRTLVTLGTPHSGTRVAPLANAHPIVRQMRPGSPVIEELARPAPGCRTQFVSFWSDLDQVMDPLESACLHHPDLNAQNVQVTGIGHLALPVHPAVATGIRQALDEAAAPHGNAPATGAARATAQRPHPDDLTVA
ncbi:alpha/beta fold hydrolase [Streptomyces sp. C6-003]